MEVSNNNSGRTQISDTNAGSGGGNLLFPGAHNSGSVTGEHFENESAEVENEADSPRRSNIMSGNNFMLKRSISFNKSSNSVNSQEIDDNFGR